MLMRPYFLLTLVVLGGCGSLRHDPTDAAKQCVSKSVPDGGQVSAQRAHDTIDGCQAAIGGWLNSSMRHACLGPCDYRDPKNIREREALKESIEELLMGRISDKVQSPVPAAHRRCHFEAT